MKTNNINSFIPRLFALALFVSTSFSAIGQDLIRETVDYLLCDTSIIRETSKDTVLIYNQRRNHFATSTFMLVTQGDNYTFTMYIEPIYVNDFEVFDKNVFFCGYKLEDGIKKAIIGSFSLHNIPNYDSLYFFRYYVIDECKEFKKLDVYRTDEGIPFGTFDIHVVSTGTTGTRSDALVDMVMMSSLPGGVPINCNLYLSNDTNENLDDVAVTDNYVIVSSRTKDKGDLVVNFWHFGRPTVVGENIFCTSINNLCVKTPIAETPVFLEHTKVNDYVATYKINGYSRIAMLQLEALNPNYNSVEITGIPMDNIFPMDIKYNRRNGVHDILARGEAGINLDYDLQMKIYHITPAIIQNTAPYGEGTWYPYNQVWSIDPQNKTSNRFVASAGAANLVRMLRYNHYQWTGCSSRFEYNYDIGKFTGSLYKPEILIRLLLKEKTKHYPRERRPILFPVICEHNN